MKGFTYENEDAHQQRDESAGAESSGHDVGCGVAGLNGSVRVTAAHVDGECARAAEGRRAAVHHQNGQQVHVLLLTVESRPLRPNAGCVVYRVSERREQNLVIHFIKNLHYFIFLKIGEKKNLYYTITLPL